MKYILGIVICFTILFILFPSATFAGCCTGFDDVAIKDGWLVPSEQKNSNFQSCLLKYPNESEYNKLQQICLGDPNCDKYTKDWLDNMEQRYCEKIGMKVRSLSDGTFRSYYPLRLDQLVKNKREFNYLDIITISSLVTIIGIVIYDKLVSKRR